MADLEVVVTEGPSLAVQVEEEPGVFVNVAIPPPVEVVEVLVPGPAGPPGDGSIATHEAAADPHTGYQKESEKGGANGYASLDGDGLVPISQLPPGSSDPADASTTLKGISKLSSAPASPTNPIAVGDNDARVPTQGENDALVGTNGTPSSTNLFVTDSDPRNTDARTPSSHEHDHIANLATDSHLVTAAPSDFPIGTSEMPSTDTETPNTFAYYIQPGAVRTIRYHDDDADKERCIQVLDRSDGGVSSWRAWDADSSLWLDWEVFAKESSLNNYQWAADKGQPNGYAALDATGVVPVEQLPATSPTSTHASSHKGDGSDPIDNATTSVSGLESAADKTKLDGIESGATADQTAAEILTAIKTVDGSGSGLDADTLDGHDAAYFAISSDLAAKADLVGGVVPTSQIPALAINDVFTVASQAAMLALTAQRGDIAVRTDFDPDRTYMLSTDSPGTLADWIRVTFGDVVSVNGQTGVIVLGYADVGAASTSDTRIPTQGENDALVGTNGTPSTSNKFVTDSDSRNSNARTPTAHATTHTNGTDDIQSATASQKGLMTTTYASKLDGIEAGATADQTASEIRAAIKYADDAFNGAAALSSYDTGFSYMYVTSSSSGWPIAATPFHVVTMKQSGSSAKQQATATTSAREWQRHWTGSAWSSWIETTDVANLQGYSALATDAEVSTAISTHEAASDPHTGYQKESEKNAANGYPGLGATPGTMDSTTVLYGDGVYRVPTGGLTKYTATIGDGSTVNIVVTHNLGTRSVVVSVHDATTYDEYDVNVNKTTINTVTLSFPTGLAPATNSLVVTVI